MIHCRLEFIAPGTPRCAVRRPSQPRRRNPPAVRAPPGAYWTSSGASSCRQGRGQGAHGAMPPSMHQGGIPRAAWPAVPGATAQQTVKRQPCAALPRESPALARVPGTGPHTPPPPGTQRTRIPLSSTHLARRAPAPPGAPGAPEQAGASGHAPPHPHSPCRQPTQPGHPHAPARAPPCTPAGHPGAGKGRGRAPMARCPLNAPGRRRLAAWPPGRRSPTSPHNKPQGGGHAPRSRVNPPPWARVPGGGPHTQPPPGAPTTQRTPAPASPPSSTHLAARDGREPEFGILNSAFAPNASKSRRRFQAAVLCVRTGNITLSDERGRRLRL